MTIKIDDEHITYTGLTATTLTGCTRGADGTTATANADNEMVVWWDNDHDAENSPVGDGTTRGDGFWRYEEYRGFLINGTHTRTNPNGPKDAFLCDEDTLGNEDFDATGLTIWMLKSDGSEYSGSRVVNFKSDDGSPPGHTDQKGIRMYDAGWHDTYYGLAEQRGTPNECDWVRIYTLKIANDDPGGLYAQMLKCVIGHECGHSVNIDHHTGLPYPQYLYQGDPDCVIYQPFDWNNIPHDYCTEDDDCAHSWKLH